MAGGAALQPRQPAGALAPCGDPVPDTVISILQDAYGEDVGRVGPGSQGHGADSCSCQRSSVACSGACLVYGELLPSGCARALRRLGLTGSGAAEGARGTLLELGMGTGKVALQAFVQCPQLAQVVGVELSQPRFALAAAALRRLAGARPGDFRLLPDCDEAGERGRGPAHRCLLEACGGSEAAGPGPRILDLRCGDFLARHVVTDEEFQGAEAILLQLCLPPDALVKTQQRLSAVQDGCRLFSLCDLRLKWRLAQPSHFHAWQRGDIAGQEEDESKDRYATSWAATYGMTFHTFRVSRAH